MATLPVDSGLRNETTGSTVGVVKRGGVRFIHTYADAAAERSNLFVGLNAGNFTMAPDGGNLGCGNVGIGEDVLKALTSGYGDTVVGWQSAAKLTTGSATVVIGAGNLKLATTGGYIVAIGVDVLTSLVTGSYIIAIGAGAMGGAAPTGIYDIAIGIDAMRMATSAYCNAVVGSNGLYDITTGYQIAALGYNVLANVTTGYQIVGVGFNAGLGNIDGAMNTYLGAGAGYTETPANANVSGDRNTYCGIDSGPGVTDQLGGSSAFGWKALCTLSNQVVIGGVNVVETKLRPTVYVVPDSAVAYSATALSINRVTADALDVNNANASAGFVAIRFNTKASGSSTGRIALVTTAGYGAFAFMLRSAGAASYTAEMMRIDSLANLGLGTSTFGTSAAKVLGIANGVEPSTSPADMVQLYSTDLSADNATLGLRTETAVAADVALASTHSLTIRVNGVSYKVPLTAVA